MPSCNECCALDREITRQKQEVVRWKSRAVTYKKKANAVPELLAACIEALERINANQFRVRDRLRAAIDKALPPNVEVTGCADLSRSPVDRWVGDWLNGGTMTRTPTPIGWSDTDWIEHLQKQASEEWVLVPKRPTPEMLHAAALASLGIFINRGRPAHWREPCSIELQAAEAAWSAMLEVTPNVEVTGCAALSRSPVDRRVGGGGGNETD